MKEATKSFLIFTAGLSVGGVAGYFATKKYLEVKYEQDLQMQIQDVKDHYKLIRKEGEYAAPETVPVDYENVLEGLEYIEHSEEGPEAEDVNPVFVDEEEVVETEETEFASEYQEEYERDRSQPYIITVKEFMEDRDEYDKTTITYFEDDDVLCDEREEVIPNVEYTVGNDALTKFGELSEDKNIVYVRNERTSTDFEIVRDRRSYAEVVLGYKEDKAVKKMREDD
jgi:hypothetical protein